MRLYRPSDEFSSKTFANSRLIKFVAQKNHKRCEIEMTSPLGGRFSVLITSEQVESLQTQPFRPIKVSRYRDLDFVTSLKAKYLGSLSKTQKVELKNKIMAKRSQTFFGPVFPVKLTRETHGEKVAGIKARQKAEKDRLLSLSVFQRDSYDIKRRLDIIKGVMAKEARLREDFARGWYSLLGILRLLQTLNDRGASLKRLKAHRAAASTKLRLFFLIKSKINLSFKKIEAEKLVISLFYRSILPIQLNQKAQRLRCFSIKASQVIASFVGRYRAFLVQIKANFLEAHLKFCESHSLEGSPEALMKLYLTARRMPSANKAAMPFLSVPSSKEILQYFEKMYV